MESDSNGLVTESVSFAYNVNPVVSHVSFTIRPGQTVALTGPNGSGKTTLLKLLSGSLLADSGRVLLDARDIRRIPHRSIAKRVAVVAQQVDSRLMFEVQDLISMGRTPYIGLFGAASQHDRQAITLAMHATDTEHLAERRFDELSGGEQQRVMLAMALAQETDFLLLDEPTVHLDLRHQHELLEMLMRLHAERKIGILAVMHDLNLAALYFEHMAVMNLGALIAEGPPTEIMADGEALGVFQAPLSVVEHPRSQVPQVLLDRVL